MLCASEVFCHYRTVIVKDQTSSNFKGAPSWHFDPAGAGKGGEGTGLTIMGNRVTRMGSHIF